MSYLQPSDPQHDGTVTGGHPQPYRRRSDPSLCCRPEWVSADLATECLIDVCSRRTKYLKDLSRRNQHFPAAQVLVCRVETDPLARRQESCSASTTRDLRRPCGIRGLKTDGEAKKPPVIIYERSVLHARDLRCAAPRHLALAAADNDSKRLAVGPPDHLPGLGADRHPIDDLATFVRQAEHVLLRHNSFPFSEGSNKTRHLAPRTKQRYRCKAFPKS